MLEVALFTKQLKDAWLAELRDHKNTKIVGNFVRPKEVHEWMSVLPRTESRPKVEPICTNEHEPMQKASCLCAVGCLIKAHAKCSTKPTFLGMYITYSLPHQQVTAVYNMSDREGKSFAEIANWVEQNCAVAV